MSHPFLVFEDPVSRLEKDWKKTGLQSWSFIFKNQRLEKDRSLETGPDWFKLVFGYPFERGQRPCKLMKN